MVGVDRRTTGLNPSHIAGLRRLSARASATAPPSNRRSTGSGRAYLRAQIQAHVAESAIKSVSSADKQARILGPVFDHCYVPCNPVFHVDENPNFCFGSDFGALPKNSCFSHCRQEMPEWVGEYITQIGSVLKEGGWGESDVEEIVHVSASGFLEDEMNTFDNKAVLDALLLKADRFSDLLRKSGWCPEEVSDCLGLEFRSEKGRRVQELSPKLND